MLWRSWRREFWSTWLSGSLKTTSRAPFFVLWGPQELVKLVLGDQLPRLWDENSTGLLSEGSVISLIFEATGNYFFLFWLHFVLLFVAECIDYYDCLTNADKFCLSQILVVSNWFFLAFNYYSGENFSNRNECSVQRGFYSFLLLLPFIVTVKNGISSSVILTLK